MAKQEQDPKVTYPARGSKPEPPAPRRRPLADHRDDDPRNTLEGVVGNIATAIEDAGGHWTSQVFRGEENPPSAAMHALIAGKRYVVIVQPLDMPDRSS